jgi:hypothetical protein
VDDKDELLVDSIRWWLELVCNEDWLYQRYNSSLNYPKCTQEEFEKATLKMLGVEDVGS